MTIVRKLKKDFRSAESYAKVASKIRRSPGLSPFSYWSPFPSVGSPSTRRSSSLKVKCETQSPQSQSTPSPSESVAAAQAAQCAAGLSNIAAITLAIQQQQRLAGIHLFPFLIQVFSGSAARTAQGEPRPASLSSTSAARSTTRFISWVKSSLTLSRSSTTDTSCPAVYSFPAIQWQFAQHARHAFTLLPFSELWTSPSSITTGCRAFSLPRSSPTSSNGDSHHHSREARGCLQAGMCPSQSRMPSQDVSELVSSLTAALESASDDTRKQQALALLQQWKANSDSS